ncbi:hypothetical protein BGX38DRAFT_867829 [Terfezia claveryi]|nr:hypothetical protein BGX38DRAFT_867829 [Terfezia claveryi]
MSSFMTGLQDVINMWLRTYSGVKYQDQYMHRRAAQHAAVAAAADGGNLAPSLPAICISRTLFPRGPGIIPDIEDQVDAPKDASDQVHNRFLPFFFAYVTRPKCVQHVWRYNLKFVDQDLLASWDRMHVQGNPPVPLFSGLTAVVKALASKMLIHVLENRRQQWAVSGLPSAFAKTAPLTFDQPDVAMEPFTNAGMGGVKAYNSSGLDVNEREDRVQGEPVGIDGVADDAWDGANSW